MLVAIEKGWVCLDQIVMLDTVLQIAHLKNGGTLLLRSDECKAINRLMIQECGGVIYPDSVRLMWTLPEMQDVIKDWVQGVLGSYFDDEYAFARELTVESVHAYSWSSVGTSATYVYIEDQQGRTRSIHLKIDSSWHELEMYENLMSYIQKFVFEDFQKGIFDGEDD